jgi:hypothetical protein
LPIPVRIEVTGTSFRQPALVDLALHAERLDGRRAALRWEPANAFDANAVAVEVAGVRVAYLPRTWRKSFDDAARVAVERLLAGEGDLFADLVQYRDEADEPRWTVKCYGVFE